MLKRLDQCMRFPLRPGMLLYLPRGVVHRAETLDESSVHLTIGLMQYDIVDLLATIIDANVTTADGNSSVIEANATTADDSRTIVRQLLDGIRQQPEHLQLMLRPVPRWRGPDTTAEVVNHCVSKAKGLANSTVSRRLPHQMPKDQILNFTSMDYTMRQRSRRCENCVCRR